MLCRFSRRSFLQRLSEPNSWMKRIFNNGKLKENPTSAPGALRLFFHDCFVEGCDASVLISSTEKNIAEKDADINKSLPGDGFDVFFRVKRALESQCPNVVSCADVMAMATRDLVSMVGGPSWEVLKGRRDGLISKASRVAGNLPTVNMTVDQLILLFHSKGLSPADMVTLSGGHTIGFAHCNEFMYRIYNYNKTYQVDPTMNPSYASTLRSACPREGLDPDVVAVNDVSTPTAFDNAYYQNVKRGFALLATDQILYGDPRTSAYVNLFATSQDKFFNFFGLSMIRLGNAGVKTGNQGEIRRDCGVFNN
ncbi:peroxidase 55 isoform X2 [Cryptomeria japonica]|uniref:peroxidase 55 isoform X2 n=1 Tax=Cryptomeria japonica TaxID=3369 RepID=UPI0027DA67EA|nr:peroxidase 55 isoform X2 [Cryptomeria japonica]